jgi:hypothetical protein
MQGKTKSIVRLGLLILVILCSCTPDEKFENRIGVGISTQVDIPYWTNLLGAQWYMDWRTQSVSSTSQLEYWQTIRVSENGYSPGRKELIRLLRKYPGHTWIIGNEPDNIWQDNVSAEKYAQYYYELYKLIKRYDSSARVAIGAVTQPTPLRLEYLDIVLTTYENKYHQPLPVDWWTIHAYVMREEKSSWGADIPSGMDKEKGELYDIEHHGDIQIFKENIKNFRAWLKEKGYQNTPLAITEFGILLPETLGYDPITIRVYLKSSFDWLLTSRDETIGFPQDEFRLVQKFAWFSLHDTIFPAANLVDLSTNQLSPIGEEFYQFSQKHSD